MNRKEYIREIRGFVQEFDELLRGMIYNNEFVEQEENSSKEELKNFIKKLIVERNFIIATGFKDPKEIFSKFVQKLDFDVEKSCELGGIAHLLILTGDKSNDVSSQNGPKFDIDTLKEITITELLNKGLNPNLKNEMGYTFIETSICGKPGCNKIFKYLIEHNPLLELLFNKDLPVFINKMINLAKNFGFDVNTKDNHGNSIIHTAISSPYYTGDIIDLIQTLGEEFDINTHNDDGQNILEYLDYYINNPELNSDCYNEKIIEEHIRHLKAKREDIRKYIILKNNPYVTQSKFKATYYSLEKQVEINMRISTFLGETVDELNFDLATITLDELNSLIQQELLKTKDLVNKIIEVTKEKFGIMYKEICKFVILEKESKEFSIEPIGKLLNKNSPKYPADKTITEKITWLRDSILEYDLNQKRIANAKAKAKRKQ